MILKWHNHSGKQYGDDLKKIQLLCDQYSKLCVYIQNWKQSLEEQFACPYFTIAKGWKHPHVQQWMDG